MKKLPTELKNLYSSPSIIITILSTRIGWAGHVAHTKAIRVLVGKSEIKRAAGIYKCRSENKLERDLRETG
jgi:hypothetical protein